MNEAFRRNDTIGHRPLKASRTRCDAVTKQGENGQGVPRTIRPPGLVSNRNRVPGVDPGEGVSHENRTIVGESQTMFGLELVERFSDLARGQT